MANHRFGTAVNCIDGRTQLPITEWIKKNYDVDFVDMITEPGVDKMLSQGGAEEITAIKSKVLISINAHHSNVIVVAGHHDCAGNPVPKEEHLNQIRKGVQTIRSWNLPVRVIGVWINDKWNIELMEKS